MKAFTEDEQELFGDAAVESQRRIESFLLEFFQKKSLNVESQRRIERLDMLFEGVAVMAVESQRRIESHFEEILRILRKV